MRKFALISIIASYLYVLYLSITMFLVPAFQTYFGLYGVLGTFAIWIGLTAAGYACGYFGMLVWSMPTHKENIDELS